MSRSLDDLHPEVRPLVEAFLANCSKVKIDILVTCTWRSAKEQAKLYAQGRTTAGKIVTRAKPGQSSHNPILNGKPASLAVDIVPMRNGKPVWSTAKEDGKLWLRVGALGEKAGLEWAGRWKSFPEYPHFQHPNARVLREQLKR